MKSAKTNAQRVKHKRTGAMTMAKTRRKSLANQHVQFFGFPLTPGTVFMPESLEQPDPRPAVDSITTYGVLEIPVLSGVLNAQLGASNK